MNMTRVGSISRRQALPLAISQALLLLTTVAQAATITVDDASDERGGAGCTLRSALESANTDSAVDGCVPGAGADTIVFDEGILPATITLQPGPGPGFSLGVSDETIIDGPGAEALTISGGGQTNLFIISDGVPDNRVDVTLRGMTLTGGTSTSTSSPGVSNAEILTIEDCVLTGNHGSSNGAALTTGFQGVPGAVSVIRSVISGNSATIGAGGIAARYGLSLHVTDTTISGNTGAEAGGILSSAPTTELINVELRDNVATSPLFGRIQGGGLAVNSTGTLTMANVTIAGNSAATSGGGMSVFFADAQIRDSTIEANSAAFSAGGIRISAATVTVANSTIAENSAGSGGGIDFFDDALVVLNDSSMVGNSAGEDGGGIRAGEGHITIANSTLSGNVAERDGGAVSIPFGTVSLLNATVSDNTAERGGGILNRYSGTLELVNSVVANSAPPGVEDCLTIEQALVAENRNSLVEDGSCSEGALKGLFGDPRLSPLQDNGGDTLTHAILPLSPLVDAADPVDCADFEFDQTGMPRPIDGNADGSSVCDIGAVEFVDIFPPIPSIVSAPDVTEAGGVDYELVIDYGDDSPIDPASVDIGDIEVGSDPMLQVSSVSRDGNRVTYRLLPPGERWRLEDNGLEFDITLLPGSVSDTSVAGSNVVAGGVLGSFLVAIPKGEIVFRSGFERDDEPTR